MNGAMLEVVDGLLFFFWDVVVRVVVRVVVVVLLYVML